jgi:Domain of unknown function (DUF4258)
MTEPLPFPLSRVKALALVREWSANSAHVQFSLHARKRMAQRHISPRVVLACLAKGHIVEGPSMNVHGDWEVALHFRHAGRTVHVVCALRIERRVMVITVYELKE